MRISGDFQQHHGNSNSTENNYRPAARRGQEETSSSKIEGEVQPLHVGRHHWSDPYFGGVPMTRRPPVPAVYARLSQESRKHSRNG